MWQSMYKGRHSTKNGLMFFCCQLAQQKYLKTHGYDSTLKVSKMQCRYMYMGLARILGGGFDAGYIWLRAHCYQHPAETHLDHRLEHPAEMNKAHYDGRSL